MRGQYSLWVYVGTVCVCLVVFTIVRHAAYWLLCSTVHLDDPIAEDDAFKTLLVRASSSRYGSVDSSLDDSRDVNLAELEDELDDENGGRVDILSSRHGTPGGAMSRWKSHPAMLLPPMAGVVDVYREHVEVAGASVRMVGMVSDGVYLMQRDRSELDDGGDEGSHLMRQCAGSASNLAPPPVALKRVTSANLAKHDQEVAWYEWWGTNHLLYGSVVPLVLFLALPGLVNAVSYDAPCPIQQRVFWAAVGVAAAILLFGLIIVPMGWSTELIHVLFRTGVIVNAMLSVVEFHYCNYPGFIINGTIAVGVAMHYYHNMRKLAFAQTVLAAVASCFWDNIVGFMVVLAMLMVVQCGWVLVWGLAADRVLKWMDGPPAPELVDVELAISTVNYNSPLIFPVVALLFALLLWVVAMIRFYASAMMGGVVTSWCVRPFCPIPVRASLHQVSQWSFVATCYGAVYIPVMGIAADIVALIHELLPKVMGVANGWYARGGGLEQEQDQEQDGTQAETRRNLGDDAGAESGCRGCCGCCSGVMGGLLKLLVLLQPLVVCLHVRLQTLKRRLNKYSVAVAVGRGYPVQTAGVSATVLFEQRGWVDVAHDGTLTQALSFGELLMCCFGIEAGFVASRVIETGAPGEFRLTLAVCTAGGLMGYAVGNTLAACFGTGISAMVYSIAHDRGDALSKGQPLRYQELAAAWNRDHPGTLLEPQDDPNPHDTPPI